jgi:hypothetical protein
MIPANNSVIIDKPLSIALALGVPDGVISGAFSGADVVWTGTFC